MDLFGKETPDRVVLQIPDEEFEYPDMPELEMSNSGIAEADLGTLFISIVEIVKHDISLQQKLDRLRQLNRNRKLKSH